MRARLFVRTCWGTAKLVALFLSAAFVFEYFLTQWVPQDALVPWVGNNNAFAIPIAALIGAPLYLDEYAALPLVRGLLDLGMAPGAAMTFLISGGIVSAWTALPVFALVRLPVFTAYVVMAVLGSMLAGWSYALIMP